jgi:hypothetical protein
MNGPSRRAPPPTTGLGREWPDTGGGERGARTHENADDKLGSGAALHQMQDVDVRRRDFGPGQVLASNSLTLKVEPDTPAGRQGKADET